MALRGYYDPFALVGANGKACGEAPGVSVSGTPPSSSGGVLPLDIENRYRFMEKRVAPVIALCISRGRHDARFCDTPT